MRFYSFQSHQEKSFFTFYQFTSFVSVYQLKSLKVHSFLIGTQNKYLPIFLS